MNWQSITVGASFALFLVWMERKGRWSLFLASAAGDYQIVGSRQSGGTASNTVSGSTTPAQSPPNATRAGTGAPAQATQPSGGTGPGPTQGGNAGNINPNTGHSYSPPAATTTGGF